MPRERLGAGIQAFGGDKWAAKRGWPRRPSFLAMRCLTYLGLVHGARGLFSFSYPGVRADTPSWEGLQKIAAELQQLQTWLALPIKRNALQLTMTSPFKTDFSGRPAVHYCLKSHGRGRLLALVNVIARPVSLFLEGFDRQGPWLTEIFQKHKSVVCDGNIREELGAYEVRIYSYSNEN